MDPSAERERRIQETWKRTPWTHVAAAVAATAAGMAVFGYLLRGWAFALALALAVGLGLTSVMVATKRHPDAVARGERPRSMQIFSTAVLALAVIAGVVAVAVGDWRAAARVVPAVVLIGVAHLARGRLRARGTTTHPGR
jgi:putative Mn2+ efflux pump MntP